MLSIKAATEQLIAYNRRTGNILSRRQAIDNEFQVYIAKRRNIYYDPDDSEQTIEYRQPITLTLAVTAMCRGIFLEHIVT